MIIRNQLQLENTKSKLQEAEERYCKRQEEPASNALVQELTLRSLKQTINQLKEEISRYEAHVKLPD